MPEPERATEAGTPGGRRELPSHYTRCADLEGRCPLKGICARYRDPHGPEGAGGYYWLEFKRGRDGCPGFIHNREP